MLEDIREFVMMLIAPLTGLFVVLTIGLALLQLTVNHVMLPIRLAEIEQLRRDAANVSPVEAEATIGQVAEWNRQIASNRAFNQSWVFGWMVPDEWDNVQFIEIGRK